MLREGRLAAKRRTHQKGGAPNGKRQSKDEKAAGVEGVPRRLPYAGDRVGGLGYDRRAS